MKFHKNEETKVEYTNVTVTFRATKQHLIHAIGVQLDSGTPLGEITRTTTKQTLELLCLTNGTEGKWDGLEPAVKIKAEVKFEDLFPGIE